MSKLKLNFHHFLAKGATRYPAVRGVFAARPVNLRQLMVVAALTVFAAACASPSNIAMQVKHPAEINMPNYKTIAFGDFRGNAGSVFAGKVKEAVVMANYYQAVDRSQLDAILAEAKLSYSDLAASGNKIKIGNLLPASALLQGSLSDNYTEGTSSHLKTCYKTVKEGDKYVSVGYQCTEYTRTGSATIRGSVDIVDVETGRIIVVKDLSASCPASTTATDATPAPIDSGGLINTCISDKAAAFTKMIQPWTSTAYVMFHENDTDVKEMVRGIQMVRLGEHAEAKKYLNDLYASKQMDKGVKPEDLGKIKWNLAMIYAYTGEYDEAMKALKEGYRITNDIHYAEYIKTVEGMKADAAKLAEQSSVRSKNK